MQWWQSVSALLLTISPALAIWPAPANITTGENALWLEDSVVVTYNGNLLLKESTIKPSSDENLVSAGVQRTLDNIFSNSYVPWKFYGRNAVKSTEPSAEAKRTYITHVIITQSGKDDTDESYELTITNDGSATIEANSPFGVLHGLETFSQFFAKHSEGGIYTIQAPVHVSDKPMYEHRGVSLDVSRSYYKVDAIYRTLDAMSWNKLNRLHIHVTDAQSWPLEVPSIPSLSNKGSYSTETVYTTTDIENIQQYGALRGIEVYFEIDTPGHTSSIAFSHPELIAAFEAAPYILYCNEPPCGTLRLNDSAVDTFLDKLMGDLLPRLSPYSSYFHTGGDEVKYNAYTLDPTVGTNNTEVINELLQRFYDKQHARVRASGMTPMVWEEVPLDYNVSIGSDVVVQTWLSADSVKAVTSMGNRVIDSGYDYWYLDCGRGNFLNFNNGEDYQTNYPFPSWCDPFKNWILVYSHDPSAGLTENETSLVLGGEVAVWSESIDDVTLDSLLWPRASAAGEVLWSGRIDPSTGQNRSEVDASIRLSQFRETMVARGVGSSLVVMPFCTQGMNGTICEVSA